METLSNTSQGDSSVKSDDSSPQHENGRSSPPPNCAICLGTCKNKSFTDSCLHQFCFRCILKWSKVKAECPLCKQIFKSIIHNVRSNHQYEEYMVEQRTQVEDIERINNLANATQRFRYRTTLTLPYRDSWAIEHIISNYRARHLPPANRHRQPSYFRRTVYRHNLWARPLPDFTGRYRDCAPEFYRCNGSQMHRLVPWLSRELHYLLNENVGHTSYVMTQIMDLLLRYHINSTEFREAMQRYFGDRTEHFLHELYCFASTPYDMAGYDRNVQYTTDSRVSTMVNEVISSSDNESSLDSEANLDYLRRLFPIDTSPGPSRDPAPVYPLTSISNPSTNDVIPIETISHSDSDDNSSEVIVVGYIKPPHARTPEVVDLLESDSDVVIEDDPQVPQPMEAQTIQDQERRPEPFVKLTLKQHSGSAGPSAVGLLQSPSMHPFPANRSPASDDTAYTPPLPRRSTSLSDNSTYIFTSTSSESDFFTSSSSTSTEAISYYSDSSSESYKPRTSKPKKKKTKRKSSKSEKAKKKSKRSKQKSKSEKSKKSKSDAKQGNRKSNSGKGVKSSKSLSATSAGASNEKHQTSLDQPSTSGTQSSRKNNKRKRLDKIQHSPESKRLKSAISVVNNQRYLRGSTSSEASSHTFSSESYADEDSARIKEKKTEPILNDSNISETSDVSYFELSTPPNFTDSC